MDSKYIIGVPEMDEQHEKLLALATKAKQTGYDEIEMNSLVLELLNYATSHLDQEEAFLKKNGLIAFEQAHSKKHRLFRAQAMEFYSAFRDTVDAESKATLLVKIGEFCDSWLKEHIDVEDRAYGMLLNARKSG